MRFLPSGLIKVLDIRIKDTLQLLLLEDEQVIETLAPHTAQKAFTDGIGARSVIGCFQYLCAIEACHRLSQVCDPLVSKWLKQRLTLRRKVAGDKSRPRVRPNGIST
jgi:hypothetical protein